ncbi:hypothetical protein I3842_Q000700 [Carya illinoinensis]|uniref:Uncharacterized protein n=1 Tax=Carya illinoinensis TaxID=32201 RepID=A0A921ZZ62_CARIL|nr:hypothetical protein I3842_Q000700 [Carya illinoinensis]
MGWERKGLDQEEVSKLIRKHILGQIFIKKKKYSGTDEEQAVIGLNSNELCIKSGFIIKDSITDIMEPSQPSDKVQADQISDQHLLLKPATNKGEWEGETINFFREGAEGNITNAENGKSVAQAVNPEEVIEEIGVKKTGWKKRVRQSFMDKVIEMEPRDTMQNETDTKKRDITEVSQSVQQGSIKKKKNTLDKEFNSRIRGGGF